MYAKFWKRVVDFTLSLIALIILLPLLLVLTIIGAIVMRGNPFFTQERPGWHEKIFKLIKFRTMSNKKDKNGNLLPDQDRMTGYGRMLRKTSIDELPELINILKGDMAIVGPRPLLVKYLPYYTKQEARRHEIRPGLTGWAQVHGRNSISSWEQRFCYDVEYVDKISLKMDLKIIILTIKNVLKSEGVVDPGLRADFDEYRKEQEGIKNEQTRKN